MNAIKSTLIPHELNILQRRIDKLSLLILTNGNSSSLLEDEERDSITKDIGKTEEELILLIKTSVNRLKLLHNIKVNGHV